jgi:adenylate cyclase
VVGQSTAQTVYEVMARSSELSPQQAQLRTRYAEGLVAYRAGHWDEARRAFNAALETSPGDGPALALLERIERLAANPLAPDWDGTWQTDQK